MARFVRCFGLPNIPGSDQVSFEQLAQWVLSPPTNPPRFIRVTGTVGQTGTQWRSIQQLVIDLVAPITATYHVITTDGLVGLAGGKTLTLQELSPYLLAPLQFVATRGYLPGNENPRPTSTGAHTRGDARLPFTAGRVAATDLRLLFDNFRLTGTAPETDGYNTITVDGSLEIASTIYQGSFSGSTTKVIAATDAHQSATFPTLTTLAADATGFIRCSVSVASLGLLWPGSTRVGGTGSGMVENASTSQTGNTGTLVTGGGSARTIGYVPSALIGRPASKMTSIFILGDSNPGYGFGDTPVDAAGNYGIFPRSCESINGRVVPWHCASRSGDTIAYALPATNPRRYANAIYATHSFVGLGTNEIPLSTVATMQAELLLIFAYLRANTIGGKVYACAILPRTDTTNTTPISGYEPAGKPDQLNTWLYTQIGVTIDGVLNFNNGTYNLGAGDVAVNAGVKVQATGLWSDPSYFVAGDGTHLSAAGTDICVAVARAAIAVIDTAWRAS